MIIRESKFFIYFLVVGKSDHLFIPDRISLSKEFFDGADIDIEIKEHGMTKQAVTETIRICKDRNILKQYLSSKEVEVVTIMMSLFDDEQIMRTYEKDIKRETLIEKSILMLKKGKINIDYSPGG